MQITVHDYDHSALKPRSYSDQTLVFPAYIGDQEEPTGVLISAFDFITYLRDTEIIHPDSFVSDFGQGLVSIPTIGQELWDAGRQEFYEQPERPVENNFAGFLADFSGCGLSEAITQYLNDCCATSPKFALKQTAHFLEYFPKGSPQRTDLEKLVSEGKVEYMPLNQRATICEGAGEKVFIFEAKESNGTIWLDYETFVL